MKWLKCLISDMNLRPFRKTYLPCVHVIRRRTKTDKLLIGSFGGVGANHVVAIARRLTGLVVPREGAKALSV
jgi:hypothetical protein